MHGVVVGEGKKWFVRWDIDQETTTAEISHLVKESDMHPDETPEKPSETMKKSDELMMLKNITLCTRMKRIKSTMS